MVEDHVYTAVTSYMDNAAEKGESTNSSVIFKTIYMLPDKYAEEASEIYDNTTEKTAAAASAAAADASNINNRGNTFVCGNTACSCNNILHT